MSRGTIILVVILALVVAALVALGSVDTRVAPHEVQKDMVTDAAPAK